MDFGIGPMEIGLIVIVFVVVYIIVINYRKSGGKISTKRISPQVQAAIISSVISGIFGIIIALINKG
jgi:hypothetical protein